MSDIDPGLAAALAKAQASYPAIPRDKEVTVTTKSGGSYKFKYAPLDTILNAVRKPLADNGLAVTQTLDGGDLVTMLIHGDGGAIVGRLPIPEVDGVQAFGSAITYLRRYSLQAILGIAAEEDDDGNHAAGNTATFGGQQGHAAPETEDGGLIGTAIAQGTQDFELRQGPDGYTLPFRVKNGRSSFIVLAEGKLAEALATIKERVIDQRVTVWGHWTDESFMSKGKKVAYRVLHLERIETPDGTLPPVDGARDETVVGPPADDRDEDIGPEPPPDLQLVGEAS